MKKKCPKCDGTGRVVDVNREGSPAEQTCPKCHGTGEARADAGPTPDPGSGSTGE